jgi:hypothetical protein
MSISPPQSNSRIWYCFYSSTDSTYALYKVIALIKVIRSWPLPPDNFIKCRLYSRCYQQCGHGWLIGHHSRQFESSLERLIELRTGVLERCNIIVYSTSTSIVLYNCAVLHVQPGTHSTTTTIVELQYKCSMKADNNTVVFFALKELTPTVIPALSQKLALACSWDRCQCDQFFHQLTATNATSQGSRAVLSTTKEIDQDEPKKLSSFFTSPHRNSCRCLVGNRHQ